MGRVEISPSMRRLAILSTSIGIGFEWYDFFLYGLLATILAKYYFPSKVAYLSLVWTYLVFFIGFLARPLGGIVFGWIGDRHGRIYPLYFTLLLAGISSLIIAITPTYYQIGIAAPVIVAAMRFLDGFALGGEWGGSFSLTSEYINPGLRGFYSGILQATVSIATLLISGLSILLTIIMGSSGFDSVGWRILFAIGFVVAIIALIVRLRLAESPVFRVLQERGRVTRNPLGEAVRRYWGLILAAIFMVGVFNGIYYYTNYTLSISYSTTLAKEFGYHPVTLAQVDFAILIVSIVGIFASPLFGLLSDRIGRRPQILADAVFSILFAAPYFLMLRSGNPALVTAAILLGGLFIYYLAGAITPIVLTEAFPPEVRYTGISLSYQLGVGILGGVTPLLMTYLIGTYHNMDIPIYYVIITGVIALIAALIIGETRGRLHEGEEILKQS